MSTIVTRAGKGSALSWTETDANFTNLNNDKAEANDANVTGYLYVSGNVTITDAADVYSVATFTDGAITFASALSTKNKTGATGSIQTWKSDAGTTVATLNNAGVFSAQTVLSAGQLAAASPAGPGALGIVTIGDATAANNPLTGSTQIGLYVQPTGTTAATAGVEGMRLAIATADSAYTTTNVRGFYAAGMTPGSGATITRIVKFFAYADVGGTNNAGYQYGTSTTWTGNWSLYIDAAYPSYHASRFCIGSVSDDTANALQVTGNVALKAAGNGLLIKEGSNACMGAATLVAGTVVVSTTKVTATSRIFLTVQSLGTVSTPKAVGITARSASTSFTITSADATDTSVVAWQIVEPA